MSYKRVTEIERNQIYGLRQAGKVNNEIARICTLTAPVLPSLPTRRLKSPAPCATMSLLSHGD